MNKEEKIAECYRRMYLSMVKRDIASLDEILSDDFVLVHMTGSKQPKAAFLKAVENKAIAYLSVVHEKIDIKSKGNTAELRGQSLVEAVFPGGGPHTWRLQQDIKLSLVSGRWKMIYAVASTY